MTPAIAYVTAADRDEALAIGREAVKSRLAASANVIADAASFFWWEGKLREAHEAIVVIKTREDLIDALIDKIKAMHSYAAARSVDMLWAVIGESLDAFSPAECAHYLKNASYVLPNRKPL